MSLRLLEVMLVIGGIICFESVIRVRLLAFFFSSLYAVFSIPVWWVSFCSGLVMVIGVTARVLVFLYGINPVSLYEVGP